MYIGVLKWCMVFVRWMTHIFLNSNLFDWVLARKDMSRMKLANSDFLKSYLQWENEMVLLMSLYYSYLWYFVGMSSKELELLFNSMPS